MCFTLTYWALGDYMWFWRVLHSPIGVLTCLHSPIWHWGITMWFWRVYTHPFGTRGIIMWFWRVYTHPLGTGGIISSFDMFYTCHEHWGTLQVLMHRHVHYSHKQMCWAHPTDLVKGKLSMPNTASALGTSDISQLMCAHSSLAIHCFKQNSPHSETQVLGAPSMSPINVGCVLNLSTQFFFLSQ